jgi:membrane-bound serine protease (ClpP class)
VKRTVPWLCGLLLLAPQLLLADPPVVREVEFERMVNPFTAMRIIRAIDEAEEAGDELVLIRLNTPGGLVTSMEQVVQRMLNSKVPVVAWVAPSGAHAASAGFLMLIAADVAAMSPGTRTGAASTIVMGGENREDDVALKKSNEDLAALVRSIANRRGRNPEVCEQAVFAAKAYEESVALELGLIDLVVGSQEELLEELDGREVSLFDGTVVTLRTAGASFVRSDFSFRHTFMEALAHPIVAYLLLLGGLAGLYVEFTTPGAVFPGVVGALCLLLFALTAQALPISAVGVLLILLAVVMFILEIKVVSYGMLTFGGVVALVLGSWLLIDGPIPELRLPFSVILPTSLAISAFCIIAVRLAAQAQRSKVGTGVEDLVHRSGTVTRELAPEGSVFVRGEIWAARTAGEPIEKGVPVKVVRVDGLRLVVERDPDAPANRS